MILRLVYSFFFISLVTGDQQGHYGSTAHGLINANPVHSNNPQSRLETKTFNVEFVSDEIPSLQVPRPVQYVEEETEYTEKTICFTPSMVHKMIKAALEYVSQMPSDINNIVEQLDQELKRMSDTVTIKGNAVRKPLYPLDSKTIFQMLDKSRSEERTNLILKYELPSVKEPLCREALEKLIEIAYTAYLELEEHPQCRDYLYYFAAQQPEDRPTGHLDRGPDLKSLIASILDQVDKRKPNLDSPQKDRDGDMPLSDTITPQNNIPQNNIPQNNIPQNNIPQNNIPQNNIPQNNIPQNNIPQNNIPQNNIPQNNIPQNNIPQNNIPQIQEYNIPQNNIPQIQEYNIPQNNIPQIQEYNIPQNNIPQIQEYNIPQNNIPQIQEYNIPQINIPQIQEYNIPQNNIPQIQEYNIPQNNIPQIQEYDIPQNPQTFDYIDQPKPQNPEFNIPQNPQIYIQKKIDTYPVPGIPEYDVPQVQEININEYPQAPQAPELIKPEFNLPNIHEYHINEYNVPKIPEYSITTTEYNVPQINEFSVPQSNEYNVPKLPEYSIIHENNVPKLPEYSIIHENNVPKLPEYSIIHENNLPKVHEYNIPQIQEIIIPQVQSIEMPEIHETIHEPVEEIIPTQPEETINILIKLLPKSDQIDNGNLLDRLMSIIEEHQYNFHPRIFKIMLTLLNIHKQNNLPKFNDIFLHLLDSQRNRDWPWSDRVTELVLSYLIPDQNGYLEPRIVEIILNLFKKRPNELEIEHILSLLRPFKEGNVDSDISNLVLKLIYLYQHNLMLPDHVDILLKLLKLSQDANINPIGAEIIADLSRWNEMGISPNQLNGLITLLKPFVNGHPDRRPIYITHFLLTKGRHLNPKQLDFILSFLYPENGVLDVRRIDIINFLLKNLSQYPNSINILLTLLQENGPGVLNARFLEILLFLNSHSLLTPELVELVINLLVNEVTGQLEDNQVKNLFFQLSPFKQSNPKLVVDVLTLLNQEGLHGNIVKWFETTYNNVIRLPNKEVQPEYNNEYRTPDDGYQTLDTQQIPDRDFMAIFRWLESQGLITQDQGSNTDLVNKILQILQVGKRELGVVELTYMLKHEKPLIYQPVYYVKYRLPILSFISNMKNLLLENPNLNADPMKLLQELIVISNVTEVSPNLQGFPKEEILKLTFNDGDLVQAKILDEQNLSLNDQITYVHGLNSDISPEEILQLNKINEAKYFPNLVEVKGVNPETLTIKTIDKFIEVPPVHYRHIKLPVVAQQSHHQTKTIHTHHQTYIARDNPKQDALRNNSAQLRSQK